MSEIYPHYNSGIKTPKQLLAVVIAAFLIPITGIGLLVYYSSNAEQVGAGSEALTPEAITARIAPEADQGFTLKDASAPKELKTGEQVYSTTCVACHGSGAAGAPKFGDNAAWSARIATGYDKVLGYALHGLNAMPPKGGNPDLDDVEVARAMVYMVNKSGGKFPEPAVPATPVAAAPAEAAAAVPVVAAAAPAPAPVAAAAPAPAAAPVAAADAGKKLYDSTCMACHSTGAAGAPKFGDKAAWAPRIKQGIATLDEHAIKGFNAMPARGGSTASDEDMKAAVAYIVAAGK
ncbi:MAG: c-type cytochrome [Herbaspirillum sp.]